MKRIYGVFASCVLLSAAGPVLADVTPGALVDLDALENPTAAQNRWTNNGSLGGYLLPSPPNGGSGAPVLGADTVTYYAAGSGATWGTSPAALNNPLITGIEDFTMEIWLKRLGNGTGSEHHIMGMASSDGNQYIQLIFREGGDADGIMNVNIKGQTTTRDKFFDLGGGAASVFNDQWTQIAVTYSDTSKALDVYHDGSLVGSATSTQDMDATQIMNELVLFKTNPAESNDRHFNGQISRFRLYDAQLTQTQIQDNFAFGNTGVYTGPPTWQVNGPGDWNVSGNWQGGNAPVGVDSVAQFMGAISAARTVFTDTPVTAGTLRFNNANAYVLGGAGDLTLEVSSGSALIDVQAGSHKINLPLTFMSDASITIAGGATLTIADPAVIKANMTVTKTGNLVISAPLTIEAGGALVTGSGASQLFGAASMGTGAKIDVQNNTLQIGYAGQSSPAATVLSQLTSGYNDGAWDGEGIMTTSATAATGLGWVDNAANQTFTVDYTYYGDIDLDGEVNSVDFNDFVAEYGKTSGAIWAEGDFNYDGKVDTRDFNYVAGNFGAAPLASAPLGAAVPEPSTLALLSLGALAMQARRRRV